MAGLGWGSPVEIASEIAADARHSVQDSPNRTGWMIASTIAMTPNGLMKTPKTMTIQGFVRHPLVPPMAAAPTRGRSKN